MTEFDLFDLTPEQMEEIANKEREYVELTEEHKQHISEGLRRYHRQNKQKKDPQ